MDAKFHFELKDIEPNIHLQFLKIQTLIKATTGTFSEDDTYTSIANPILK